MLEGLKRICRGLIGAATEAKLKGVTIGARQREQQIKSDLCNRIAQLKERVSNLEGIKYGKCYLCGKKDFMENLEESGWDKNEYLHGACRVSTKENAKIYDRRKKSR